MDKITRELSNTEYEFALISKLLSDNTIDADINIECFSVPMNQRIWQAAKKLIRDGKVADAISVTDALPEVPRDYFFRTEVGGFGNTDFYIEKLENLRRLRFAKDIGEFMIRSVADHSMDYGDIITKVESKLNSEEMAETKSYQHVAEFTLETVNQIHEAVENKTSLSGITTGIDKLDGVTGGWQNYESIIIGARPSVGKTAVSLNFAYAALAAGKKVGFFSAEMPQHMLLKRLYSIKAEVDGIAMRDGFLKASDLKSVGEAAEWFYDKPLYINDTPNIPLYSLLTEAKRMKRKEKIDIIFIDYIGLVTPSDRSLKRNEQVNEVSKSLKQLARELAIPIVTLSQVTRGTEDKMPTLGSLSESDSIGQDADVVLFLHPNGFVDEEETVRSMKLSVAKQRNGPIEIIDAHFHVRYQKLKNIVPAHMQR